MPSFTMFRPDKTIGTLFGAGVTAVAIVLGVLLVQHALGMNVGLSQLGPLVVGGGLITVGLLFAYWSYCCWSLAYGVDRNALAIRWGGMRQIIPITAVERLIPASETDAVAIEGIGAFWPGHRVGRAHIADLGDVLFYSTHRTMKEVLFVQTEGLTYGISVRDPVFFAETVQSHQARPSLFEPRQAVHRSGPAAQSFWNDAQARLLTLVLAASFVVLLAYVLQSYPGLAQTVSLRFPALGGVLHVRDKSALLAIPRAAAALAALNLLLAVLLHGWERMVAYVLLATAIAVQALLLLAAIVAVA